VPGWRKAIISGGVLVSLPGQKGQKERLSGRGSAPGAGRKSSGLLLLSVEIITQRPVRISFLSSGMIILFSWLGVLEI